jgi:hypothetical protein
VLDGELDSSGCPGSIIDGVAVPACFGYELLADLDFDTNGDELLDASDTYWNEGSGWLAIGDYNNRFEAVFEGNGYSIYNLMINRPNSDYQGLFGYIDGATIQNLGLQGA